MKPKIFLLCMWICIAVLQSCRKDGNTDNNGTLQIESVRIGTVSLDVSEIVMNVPADQPVIITMASGVDTGSVKKSIALKNDGVNITYSFVAGNNGSELTLTTTAALLNMTDYTLGISSDLRGSGGETFAGVHYQFKTIAGSMLIDSASLNGKALTVTTLQNIDPEEINIKVSFSHPLDPTNYIPYFSFSGPPLSYSLADGNKSVFASTTSGANGLTMYNFSISSGLTSAGGYTFEGFSTDFYTGIDSTYKFPLISDEELLTLVQSQTFKYFWDFGHPASGMARERNSSGDIVTTGGSGFGIMAIIVGIERGFITRTEGLTRIGKILGFLETCDRFHGVWPHWLNGATGKTQPFSPTDNGGDLVETSYLLQGLLCFRQYLDPTRTEEISTIGRINNLFNSIEFDWFTKGEKALYWTWSPDFGYNLRIQGYNETLITYILAAASPNHTITADVYTTGFANNGEIRNGRSYYGYRLPLGQDYGGPLFFSHYSFLGLDPRNLSDQYADYWEQNVNHSLINWSYCAANPKKFPGYSSAIWGLTASDNPSGYNAHSPTNDLGVITPSAAVSSIVYTPGQSLDAIKTFYYFLGDRLWGPYGFYDAFSVSSGWWANSTLAIDQGPIICMIENYRTRLLWSLFMSAPEVRSGLDKLGFTY